MRTGGDRSGHLRASRLLPLHHQEVRNPPVASSLVVIDPLGRRLGEVPQLESGGEQAAQVGSKRPVPVLNADAAPFNQYRPLVQVVVDAEAPGAIGLVGSALGFCRSVEAARVGNQEVAAGS